jgi:vacuolar-type H+-ATPase subunit C/Vma6
MQILEEDPSGARIGEVFENALYEYLYSVAKGKAVLKALLLAKADMTNILTAVRSVDAESASKRYLSIGNIKEERLNTLFDGEEATKAFAKTPYVAFVKMCLQAKEKGLPATEAERMRDGYDAEYFSARKYELERTEPFLYYVYRRRLECANVRIVFACLLAGVSEAEIKKRLRAI